MEPIELRTKKYDSNPLLTNASIELIQEVINKFIDSGVWHFKGTVEKISDLLKIKDPETGDIWHVKENSSEYVWVENRWECLGPIIDLEPYAKKVDVSAALETKADLIHNHEISDVIDLQTSLDSITEKIPNQASSTNLLADKAFVNYAIATNAASFRGNWNSWTSVPTDAELYPVDYLGLKTPKNNDYLVIADASDYEGSNEYILAASPQEERAPYIMFVNGIRIEINENETYYVGENIVSIANDGHYIKIKALNNIIVNGENYSAGQWIKEYGTYFTMEYSITKQEITKCEGSWRFVYVGLWEVKNKQGWVPQYKIGNVLSPELQAALDSGITSEKVAKYDAHINHNINLEFIKKSENVDINESLICKKVINKTDTLTDFPNLSATEYVDGGYWNMTPLQLRNLRVDSSIYYITPFLNSNDNSTLLDICYECGWAKHKSFMYLSEIQAVDDEMVEKAANELVYVETADKKIIKLSKNIFNEVDERLVRFDLANKVGYDIADNEYELKYCYGYDLKGKQIYFDEDCYFGNYFYNLLNFNELKYFTGITSLGDGNSYRLFTDNCKIANFEYSDNIQSIGTYCFYKCENITTININKNITNIGDYAFTGCYKVSTINIDPENTVYSNGGENNECNCIYKISSNTLVYGCKNSTIPNSTKTIGNGAFDLCYDLMTVNIPEGVTNIGMYAFCECNKLTEMILPSTIKVINNYAFLGCSELTELTIPNSITSINTGICKDCSSLTNITISENATVINKQAFYNCVNLESAIIPNKVKTLESTSFGNCLSLTNVSLGTGLTNIKVSSFDGCTSLESIDIPNNVTTLGVSVFNNCSSLTDITFGTGITKLSDTAFMGCSSLNELTLTNNITSIGYSTFKNCYNLEIIHCLRTSSVPTLNGSAFDGCGNIELFEVGDSVLNNYRTASVWKKWWTNDIKAIYGHEHKITFISNCETEIPLLIVRYDNKVQEPIGLVKKGYCIKNWVDEDGNVWNFETSITQNDITLEAIWEEAFAFIIEQNGSNISISNYNGNLPNIEYSKDDGKTWINWKNQGYAYIDGINEGNLILMRGKNTSGFSNGNSYSKFGMGGKMSVSGNIMKLIDYENEVTSIPSSYCFRQLFSNCTALSNAEKLKLPAAILNDYCYYHMFGSCLNLQTAPKLPATTLSYSCYSWMFYNCSSLQNAPELPAVTLASNCYYYMFYYCSSLQNAPELPATTLANYCYSNMFYYCSSLQNAPKLPATTLASSCYSNMFSRCSSLQTAPKLPATTLTDYCYDSMFSRCSSLQNAPELPATTLASYCYLNMFYYCSSLQNAPELPATILASYCYNLMFYNCSKLLYIKVNFTTWDTSYTNNWVYNVSSKGIFECPDSLPKQYGTSYIPSGWNQTIRTTIDTATESITYTGNNYLTFTPNNDNTYFTLEHYNSNNPNIYISSNATNWYKFTGNYILKTNSPIYVIGKNTSGFNTSNKYSSFCFYGNSKITSSGSIMSLIDYETNIETIPNDYCFYYLFKNCYNLQTAPELPATTLKSFCYFYMFYYCINLVEMPNISATSLASYCCYCMFYCCSNLRIVHKLPATTLANNCYSRMFYDCSSLQTAPELPAKMLLWACYYYMFKGTNVLPDCSNIDFSSQSVVASSGLQGLFAGTKVTDEDLDRILPHNPETGKYWLPSKQLYQSCYSYMFSDCLSLQTAPELPATSLANSCYSGMFSNTKVLPDCSNIDFSSQSVVNSGGLRGLFAGTKVTDEDLDRILPHNPETGKYWLPVKTLTYNYCYSDMFSSCSSLQNAPELPATTLAEYCYCDMFINCSSLQNAPELPATTLTKYCYCNMFNNCSSLQNAPELPATTLTKYCYCNMFNNCSSLQNAPELPATTLAEYCYCDMFYNCYNLSYIKCLATSGINENNSTNYWTYNVRNSSSCTFVKSSSATWPSGQNGIPTNWTVLSI